MPDDRKDFLKQLVGELLLFPVQGGEASRYSIEEFNAMYQQTPTPPEPLSAKEQRRSDYYARKRTRH